MAHRKKRKEERYIVFLLVVLILELCVAFYYFFLRENPALNVRGTLTLEAGSPLPKAVDFLHEEKEDMQAALESAFPKDAALIPGTYKNQLIYGEELYPVTLEVEDTTPPMGTLQSVTVSQTKVPAVEDFIVEVSDVTAVTTAFKEVPDVSTAGDKRVTIVLTDTSGNKTELTTTLTVVADAEAPVITGVKDITCYQGDAVSYRKDIAVSDNMDTAPVLTIDNSQVDLSTPGTYQVTYRATDYCGNEAKVTATVTVYEKKDGYVDLDTIYALVDKTLTTIIKDGMTTREQVKAIYNWAHSKLGYKDHSNKDDWHQAAYVMLTKNRGDCFNYFAVTKLMFERLGIPNIDVVKVKPYAGASNHYWSMVSVDGGETYYHFDATPRANPGYFCLITDAALDKYSDANKGSHNRDKSLYPATPEK